MGHYHRTPRPPARVLAPAEGEAHLLDLVGGREGPRGAFRAAVYRTGHSALRMSSGSTLSSAAAMTMTATVCARHSGRGATSRLQTPCPPPPPVDIPGPKSRRWGVVPHRRDLDAPGHWRGPLPSSVQTRHGAVKPGKSGGSVGTTSQGEGRGSREGKIGQGGRGRTQGGERPMGTAPCGGNRFKGRGRVSSKRPIGAAGCRRQHNRASCQPPLPAPRQGEAMAAAVNAVHAR